MRSCCGAGSWLSQRPGHLTPASLLTSQLETLEELQSDESGLMIESTGGTDATVERIRKLLVLLAVN